ncbi:DUF6090 family protein [Sediminicola sp. YIK13]|uniref:DUF6090 family protein n=2 Tax=Sediminicola sp. YIK13 TaxID=1453352 RepID=UPI00078278CE|nr:DUF6090 family protein [Sediminicola sp. YIK13]
MIKFFRRIRQQLLSENKFSKYLLYAVGEIVLVVIGILIAVQINSWHSKIKEDKLKAVYIKNLINDFTKDTIQLNARIKDNEDNYYTLGIDSIITYIESPLTTLLDIKNLAKNKPLTGLRTINQYNVNTFNILVSTGDISLFEDALVQKVMELNRLQNFEIDISNGNRRTYFEMYNSYLKEYIPANRSNKTVINEIWDNKNATEHAPLYINTIQIQKHAINRYVELTKIVLAQTEELLELLEERKK